ncbi:MAG TPA: hypothetical protein VGQ21_15900 [Thermoanaerobaculia bacterium]|jgi:hypothetical protein|nr:hypothetical protein [Thermoanaerobaculia bacterium]
MAVAIISSFVTRVPTRVFGRRPRPQLKLLTRLATGSSISGPEGTKRQFHAFIGIENTGRGTARAPYLSLAVNSPYEVRRRGLDGDPGDSLRPLARGRGTNVHRFGSTDGLIIHPGTLLEVCSVSTHIHDSEVSISDLEIAYDIAAENTRPMSGRVILPGADLMQFVRKQKAKPDV